MTLFAQNRGEIVAMLNRGPVRGNADERDTEQRILLEIAAGRILRGGNADGLELHCIAMGDLEL